MHKRYLVILGSLIPDVNPVTQPHREENLLIRIFNNYKAIETSKSEFEKSVRLGILLHYVCDYFCYAHNYNLDISHGKNHVKYEIELHKLLKNGYGCRLSTDIQKENFMKYIIDSKNMYDLKPSHTSRDLKYCLTIVEDILSYSIINFKLKKGFSY